MMEESIRKYRRKPRIDVVPLIDVLMVLIIFPCNYAIPGLGP